jgi:hypothetical protein
VPESGSSPGFGLIPVMEVQELATAGGKHGETSWHMTTAYDHSVRNNSRRDRYMCTKGGTRTLTRCEPDWILSPARLPIPPLWQVCWAVLLHCQIDFRHSTWSQMVPRVVSPANHYGKIC